MPKISKITYYEREKIELYLKMGNSHRWIGKRLCRGHTDISREAKRNRGAYFPYRAVSAQRIHKSRQRKKNKKKLEKFEYAEVRKYVIKNLREDFSPEQIAGRLKKQPSPSLGGLTVSYESIYQYIYNGEGRFEYLYPHLRTRRHKRQRRFDRRKHNKIKIKDRISIHLRPKEISSKDRIGDWETDSMLFSKQKNTLSAQYERKTMLCRLRKLKSKEAEETENAIAGSIESLPNELWRSITRDNGLENARHLNTLNTFNVQSYFCDAYASWQKGGIENLNKLIRQYLPRKTDMSKISDDDIYAIQERLNNRPRKSLNYLTPNEVVAKYIKSGAVNP